MIANTHSVNWDDLRFFLAVAEHGSLSGAARVLNVNHSTVFRRINQFEQAISVRLFERLADGYHLTQAGEEMMRHAARMRDEVDRLSLNVVGKDVQPAGLLRITAPDSLAYFYINEYLEIFSRRHPGIDIEINVSNEDLDLSRRETDIAVRATSKPPPHLIGRKIFSAPWAFYASSGYLHAHGAPSSMSDLSNHSLIGPCDRISRLKAFQLVERDVAPVYRLRGNTLMAIASLAVAGAGIALLPDDQRHTGMTRLFALRPAVTSDIWLLTHPELRATERVRLLMGFLTESFRGDERVRRFAA